MIININKYKAFLLKIYVDYRIFKSSHSFLKKN